MGTDSSQPDQPSDAERLARLFRAHHPLVWIPTHEEGEALRVVREAAIDDCRRIYTWSCVQGVSEGLLDRAEPESGSESPIVGLARLAMLVREGASAIQTVSGSAGGLDGEFNSRGGGGVGGARWPVVRRPARSPAHAQDKPPVAAVIDVVEHLGDPRVLRVFRDACQRIERDGGVVVLIDHCDRAPAVVESHAQRFELSLPEEDEIDRILRSVLRQANQQAPVKIDIKRSELRAIIRNLRGLTRRQVERVVREIIADDRVLDSSDLGHVISIKRRTLAGAGLLEHVEAPADMSQIGGMSRLKAWLKARENCLTDEAVTWGVLPPRGVLMLGVQGAGKSLCAKAIATAWRRPLVRMNVGALYDRYVGESERKLREALRQTEAMSPVILWIDEIEKAFASAASQSTDGGLSKRMFGELLTWLQEHDSPVFTVATANDIEALPPELMRKGRFDEIFFVDLPGEEARRQILGIHLSKRKRDPSAFDLDALVRACAGFSGAEIEQAILAALHESFAARCDLDTRTLLNVINSSPPLSVTMSEKIDALRAWARGRCVPAD
ncbi:MAG: AAA family ATPase [Phycisphaeraceae bacterium]|nr:AAA family ATPase [Phycisphaeraceae bacterium]